MTIDLDELERLAAAASWREQHVSASVDREWPFLVVCDDGEMVGKFDRKQDAEFHIAARRAVPELIAEVRRLRAVADAAVRVADLVGTVGYGPHSSSCVKLIAALKVSGREIY